MSKTDTVAVIMVVSGVFSMADALEVTSVSDMIVAVALTMRS